MEALKKRLSEVEGRLKDQTATVGALTQERDRLLIVKGELNNTIRRQANELNTLKREHEVELLRLVEVLTAAEAGLQKERDGAVQKLEVATDSHRRALLAVQGQANDALAALFEMDEQIGGRFLSLSHPATNLQPALDLQPKLIFLFYVCTRMLARHSVGRRGGRRGQPTSPAGERRGHHRVRRLEPG